MTPIKRISREPTEEQLEAADLFFTNESFVSVSPAQLKAIHKAMFDAAPDIESEAEKRAQRFLKTSGLSKLALNEPAYLEAVEIIRALLRERGRKV